MELTLPDKFRDVNSKILIDWNWTQGEKMKPILFYLLKGICVPFLFTAILLLFVVALILWNSEYADLAVEISDTFSNEGT